MVISSRRIIVSTFFWEDQMSLVTEPLMDRKTAAKYLGISPGTMAVWDCTKRYNLRPIKVGRHVRYRKSDLDKFLDEQIQG